METPRADRYLNSEFSQKERAAYQLAALADISDRLEDRSQSKNSKPVIFTDDMLYHFAGDRTSYYSWATGALDYYLSRNGKINTDSGQSLAYRVVTILEPSALPNPFLIKQFTRSVIFNLHIQLWHGLVVCVVFIDPRYKHKFTRADSIVIPSSSTVLRSPDFHLTQSPTVVLENLANSDRYTGELRDMFDGVYGEAIWLWYDEKNFSLPRLRGSRWEAIRRLFYRLGPSPFVCRMCGEEKDDVALDHILPIAWGHPQTLLNFELLCGRCNSFKGQMAEGHDPFSTPGPIVEKNRTDHLRRMLRERPAWLDNVTRFARREHPRQALGI